MAKFTFVCNECGQPYPTDEPLEPDQTPKCGPCCREAGESEPVHTSDDGPEEEAAEPAADTEPEHEPEE